MQLVTFQFIGYNYCLFVSLIENILSQLISKKSFSKKNIKRKNSEFKNIEFHDFTLSNETILATKQGQLTLYY